MIGSDDLIWTDMRAWDESWSSAVIHPHDGNLLLLSRPGRCRRPLKQQHQNKGEDDMGLTRPPASTEKGKGALRGILKARMQARRTA